MTIVGRIFGLVGSTPLIMAGIVSLTAPADAQSLFADPVNYDVGSANTITVADLNGDGLPDVITARPNAVIVHIATGPLTYAAPVVYRDAYTLNLVRLGVLAADFDGDGDIDLAYVTPASMPTFTPLMVSILSNQGDGTFVRGGRSPVLTAPLDDYRLYLLGKWAVADMNGDGLPDIVTSSSINGGPSGDVYFQVVRNRTQPGGRVRFRSSVNIPTGGNGFPGSIVATDVDNDGDLDLVTLTAANNKVAIFRNNGNGIRGRVGSLSIGGTAGSLSRMAAADMNDDGAVDLVFLLLERKGPLVQTFLNLDGGNNPNKPGVFKKTSELSVAQQDTTLISTQLYADDFDLDGVKDVAVSFTRAGALPGSFAVFPAQGSPQTVVQLVPNADNIMADMDGDGDIDFALVSGSTGIMSITENMALN